MKKLVQVILIIIMLSVAALLIIDSQKVVDTGTGNGAAILWDKEFESFVFSLSVDCRSDMEKVTVFREWIIRNISYNYSCDALFYQTFDVNTIMQRRSGVCFDYACLFAAMCRTQDIPCYVLDGTYRSDNTFRHAWNRVYADGQWWSLDTTRDHTARVEGSEEMGIVPIGDDPDVEDRYFIIHQTF